MRILDAAIIKAGLDPAVFVPFVRTKLVDGKYRWKGTTVDGRPTHLDTPITERSLDELAESIELDLGHYRPTSTPSTPATSSPSAALAAMRAGQHRARRQAEISKLEAAVKQSPGSDALTAKLWGLRRRLHHLRAFFGGDKAVDIPRIALRTTSRHASRIGRRARPC
jgi:hypothetical protein